MISLVTGLPGASKSFMCAQKTVELVKRNHRWYKRTGVVRQVRSNLVLSDEFTSFANAEHDFLTYWEDPEELPSMNNCDVIWEEMGAHVDSRSWEQLPLQLRRWLQQHRHRGVQIWGNCQDFSDIDVAVRRLVARLLVLVKIIGTRDPSPTTPPSKFIFAVIARFEVDPRKYEDGYKNGVFDGIEFVTRKGVELYSMHNDIKPGKYPPLQHRQRVCPDCKFVKIVHI